MQLTIRERLMAVAWNVFVAFFIATPVLAQQFSPGSTTPVSGTVTTTAGTNTSTANLDIALSALRDAVTAASPNNKTLNDLYTLLNVLAVAANNGTQKVALTNTPFTPIYVNDTGNLATNVTNSTKLTSLVANTSATNANFGTTVAPSSVYVVGGRTADPVPTFQPIPLTAGGMTIPVTVVNPTTTQSVRISNTPMTPIYVNSSSDVVLSNATSGGYVRQDLNATMAKENGGNLALAATALVSIATMLTSVVSNNALVTAGSFVLASPPSALMLSCNALRRTNCR